MLPRFRPAKRDLIGSDMIIVLVGGLHLFEGCLFLTAPTAWGTIGMSGLLRVFHSPVVAAAACFTAAVLALFGQWGRGLTPLSRFFSLLPQFSLLLITSFSAITHVLIGAYADGTARAWTFILSDQVHRILMPALYLTAMHARVRRKWI